jgi:hypothetical protein
MMQVAKAPSGRDIWKAICDELNLNLYPLPYSTLAPGVYHVYLHPEDYSIVEGIVPRIISQVQRALTAEVERMNKASRGSGTRMLGRLLDREQPAPIEIPSSGWEVHILADHNGELERGHLGIVSALSVPAAADYGGTPTTRIVKSVIGAGGRTTTVRDQGSGGRDQGSERTRADLPTIGASVSGRVGGRARLTYRDDQGTHEFVMVKDSLAVGRGGQSAWVDVQVITNARVSREHFRIRRDADGRFLIQDVSLWGTSLNGEALPPALKSPEGVVQAGAERELPASAHIGLADAIAMQFQALE